VNQVGNAWHVPTSFEPRSTMRDPVAGISAGTPVLIFSGNQFQGPGEPGNQLEAGSAVFFKRRSDTLWSSVPLKFDSARGNNKYFAAALPANTFATRDVVEYYLRISFRDHLYSAS
jgi:hypothetical protein